MVLDYCFLLDVICFMCVVNLLNIAPGIHDEQTLKHGVLGFLYHHESRETNNYRTCKLRYQANICVLVVVSHCTGGGMSCVC